MKPAYTYNATLIRVIDGDTIEARVDLGFSVHVITNFRLARIDTPEVRTKDLEEKARGLKAAARVVELLFERPMIIESTEYDKYGRSVAEVYYPDNGEWRNLSDVLLAEGLAKVYGEG